VEDNVVEKSIARSDLLNISVPAVYFSLTMAVGTLVSLGSLHILSPEFDPSYRVVSEYALGHYAWVLSLMFLTWALSSWALVFAIRSQVKTFGGRIGLLFLLTAGVGEALASVFDVTWPVLHGLAGLLGVPPLPIAAMLISASLARNPEWASAKKWLYVTANLTWMSFALLAAAMLTLRGSIAGVRVPIGWPNRLLVAIYSLWPMSVAWQALQLRRTTNVTP
jgi:hypothetical protein